VPFFFHISHIAGTTELTGFTISPTTAWHLGKKNAWKMQIQKGCDQFAAATKQMKYKLQDASSLRAKFGTGFHNVFGLQVSPNVQLDQSDRALRRS
jgi:hypothetical protein